MVARGVHQRIINFTNDTYSTNGLMFLFEMLREVVEVVLLV